MKSLLLLTALFIAVASFGQDSIAPKCETIEAPEYDKMTGLEAIDFTGFAKDCWNNGNIKALRNFKEGQFDGEFTTYWRNGKLKEHGTYVDGKREGEWVYYQENGDLREKGAYLNNQKDGQWEMIGYLGGRTLPIYTNGEITGYTQTQEQEDQQKQMQTYMWIGGAVILLILIITTIVSRKNSKKREEANRLLAEEERKKAEIKEREEKEEKETLINSLDVIKDKISNYPTLIKNLEQQDLRSVRVNVFNTREEVGRLVQLESKYGEVVARKLINFEYFLGMTEQQLIDSRGEPTKIEKEVLKTKTKIVYIYGNKSSGDVFVFVNGELERFTDR